MIRVIASAAILGALVAGGSVYAGREPAWRNGIAGWWGPAAETRLATDAWPICTAMTAMGTESDWAQLDPDFAEGKRALVAEDWNGAIAALKLASCAIRVMRTSRITSATPTGGYANSDRPWDTISKR